MARKRQKKSINFTLPAANSGPVGATLHAQFLADGPRLNLHVANGAAWSICSCGKGEEHKSLDAATASATDLLDALKGSDSLGYPASVKKSSVDWLKIESEEFVPGALIADKDRPTYVVKLAAPRLSFGVVSSDFVEYFLEKDHALSGILTLSKVSGEDTWSAVIEDSLIPSAVSQDAVDADFVPPRGYSMLPPRLAEVVPEDMRYWEEEDRETRLAKRNALVDADFFTDDNIRMVDGEIRRVVQKFYLYDPKGDAESISARKRGIDLVTLVSLQATEIQTLVLDKERFRTLEQARAWVREHGFKLRHGGKGPDITESSYRFRQRSPGDFTARSFRTITLTDGVKAVIGRPKKSRATTRSRHHNEEEYKGSDHKTPAESEKLREFNGIIYARKVDKERTTYMYAIGPVDKTERTAWREVVEIDGKAFIPAGCVIAGDVSAEVGDVIKISTPEFVLDSVDDGCRSLRTLRATAVEKVEAAPTELSEALLSLIPSETKVLSEDLNATIVKNLVDAKHEVRLIKAEQAGMEEERYVLGIVLEPNVFDSQGDIYDEQTVRDAAHWFMENMPDMGLMHKSKINDKLTILETYLAPVDFEINGQSVRRGTWLLAARVNDDTLWEGVKNGSFTGWSIGGSAIAEMLN